MAGIAPHIGFWIVQHHVEAGIAVCCGKTPSRLACEFIDIQQSYVKPRNGSGKLPPAFSLVAIEPENLVVAGETRAEHSNTLIVRFVEYCNP